MNRCRSFARWKSQPFTMLMKSQTCICQCLRLWCSMAQLLLKASALLLPHPPLAAWFSSLRFPPSCNNSSCIFSSWPSPELAAGASASSGSCSMGSSPILPRSLSIFSAILWFSRSVSYVGVVDHFVTVKCMLRSFPRRFCMVLLRHAGSFGPATLAALCVPVPQKHALCDLHAPQLRFLPRLHRRVWLSHLWWVRPNQYWYHQLLPIGVWPRWVSLKLLDGVAFFC